MRRTAEIIFFIMISACSLLGQQVGTLVRIQTHGWSKAEDGLVLSWHSMAANAATDQIDVADITGQKLVSLNVLRLVPEAAKVDISDASAIRNRSIAVAVSYISKEGVVKVRPASAIVVFDFEGHLISFLALAPWRDALRIELDADSNIWTLNSNADETRNAAESFMLTEYSARGSVLRELLPRNVFPAHSDEIHGNTKIGFAEMGRTSHDVWFWLPGSTELVTVDSSGQTSFGKTGLPASKEPPIPVNFAVDKSGDLVGQFRVGKESAVYYRWSQSSKAWTGFDAGACIGGYLAGTDQDRLIFLKSQANQAITVCAH
jgi:hypothetical protein